MVKHRQSCARFRMELGLLVAGMLMSTVCLGSSSTPPPSEADPAVQAAPSKKASTPAAKPKATAPKKTSPKKVTAKKTGGAPPAPKAPVEKEIAGRRDPFKLPGPPVQGQGVVEQMLGPLPPGTRGLLISQLRLEGIVRLDTTNTMIVVVDNNTNRAYFLRENDAVYDGVVTKITPDSVTFKQNYSEPGGPSGVRDVVKRMSPGPGEGR